MDKLKYPCAVTSNLVGWYDVGVVGLSELLGRSVKGATELISYDIINRPEARDEICSCLHERP